MYHIKIDQRGLGFIGQISTYISKNLLVIPFLELLEDLSRKVSHLTMKEFFAANQVIQSMTQIDSPVAKELIQRLITYELSLWDDTMDALNSALVAAEKPKADSKGVLPTAFITLLPQYLAVKRIPILLAVDSSWHFVYQLECSKLIFNKSLAVMKQIYIFVNQKSANQTELENVLLFLEKFPIFAIKSGATTKQLSALAEEKQVLPVANVYELLVAIWRQDLIAMICEQLATLQKPHFWSVNYDSQKIAARKSYGELVAQAQLAGIQSNIEHMIPVEIYPPIKAALAPAVTIAPSAISSMGIRSTVETKSHEAEMQHTPGSSVNGSPIATSPRGVNLQILNELLRLEQDPKNSESGSSVFLAMEKLKLIQSLTQSVHREIEAALAASAPAPSSKKSYAGFGTFEQEHSASSSSASSSSLVSNSHSLN